MAGFISGLDGDTPESIRAMAGALAEIGVDVPFLSILTPFRGTATYAKMAESGRLREGLGWEFYNGYNVTFEPRNMSAGALVEAHRALWRSAFSPRACVGRIVRAVGRLRWGALLMCVMMNGFYGWKALTGNEPISFEGTDR